MDQPYSLAFGDPMPIRQGLSRTMPAVFGAGHAVSPRDLPV
jgi:hypothetical protein